MNSQRKTKCNFCRYATHGGCMVTPNSVYCREANDEFYQYLQSKKISQPVQKSLRSWDKK
jgi:hypothetical protein